MSRSFASASNQLLRVTGSGSPVTAVPITISLWFNPVSNTVNYDAIFLKVNGSAGHYFGIYLSDDGTSKVGASVNAGSSDAIARSSTTYSAGVWSHAAAVFATNASRAAYLNGGGKGTETTSMTPTGINQIEIGAFYQGGSYFGPMNGRLAELAVWTVALTDDEVLALAKGAPPTLIRPVSLRLYWPLYGSASPEPNYIRNTTDYSAVLVNSPTAGGDHPPVRRPFGVALFNFSANIAVTTYHMRPDGDTTAGSWTSTGANLYGEIDEEVIADASLISSSSNPSSDLCKLSLSNPGGTFTTPMTLRYRYRRGGDALTRNLLVRLLEGTTELGSWTHNDISSSWVTAEQTVSASIGDPTNLFIEFTAT